MPENNGNMNQNPSSDMNNQRGSEGLGGQSQSSDSMQQGQRQEISADDQASGMERSSVADYGSSGQPLDSGDAGRGGSSGSGRTDTGGMDDMDEEGLGHSRNGAGGM